MPCLLIQKACYAALLLPRAIAKLSSTKEYPDNKEEVFKEFFQDSLASGGTLVAIDSKNGQIRGGTYNKERRGLMLNHAFKFVRSVLFLAAPKNLRSQKAIEKIGGLLIGWKQDGNGRDRFLYKITVDSLNLKHYK